ncbi:SRPBCC family protein [Acinetobacter colistiniresistens]|uniref:SRPBCC family protein n=1 Tax=Acinetobacter colistiniresistens TaxID=280145 RepID=UPI00211C8590|nr:SRPBCC family protein [Acinetobacter colistiniresistens]UUM27557.1 SRPBCC family protein [Acinetobacter colistiniresistens]
MAFWFNLNKPQDDSIFETATYHYSYVMRLPVDADQVWAGLTADRPLAWCKMLNGQYTSERPFAVGTTRAVGVVFNAVKLRERFFIWDEANRRHAFYVEQMNTPFLAMFAEDYQVTPTEEGCEFIWRFAFEPRKGLKMLFDLIELPNKLFLFDSFKRDTEKHFKSGR